ncbi:hypothetical protein BSP239C_03161 [Brevibacterium sp. 239c]|nr:hypothetical protein BSP239C_03161 [Brevibacterium sp. 239c]
MSPLTTAELNAQLRNVRENGQTDRLDLSNAMRVRDARRAVQCVESIVSQVDSSPSGRSRYIVTPA